MSVPPITSALRRLGWSDSILPREGKAKYEDVIADVFESLRTGGPVKRHHVDQTCVTLFGALPNEYLRHICKDVPYLFGPSGSGWSYGTQLNAKFRCFLLRKLYWFDGLKPVHRKRLYRMCDTVKSWTALSNMMQTVEGRCIATLLSVGDRVAYKDIDALNVSIMSNLLNNPLYHKRMKTYLKQVRKDILSGGTVKVPRDKDLCCLYKFMKLAAREGSRDEVAYRIVTLCQTRAGGIPTPAERKLSIAKWIETVTEDPGERGPPQVQPLELNLLEACLNSEQISAHARVSIGSSACFQRPKHKGGKISFAAELLRDFPLVHEYDLETGHKTEKLIISRDRPGQALFHLSIAECVDNLKMRLRVRASVINEPGAKARVVTVNDFFHGTVLGPWSHAWLRVLREYPAAKAGVSEGRHGWAFIRSITASRPDLAWVFEAIDKKLLCTDLSEATDHLFWLAIETLLALANRVLRFPTFYGELVSSLLCNPRSVTFRDGSFTWTGETTNGIFMGDAGSKVILTLANLLAVSNMAISGHNVSAIVGDDHITISRNAEMALEVYRRTVTSMGLVVSEDDTFISDRYGLYAEELIRLPDSNRATIDALIRNTTAHKDLPYIDVPKVRLLMDLTKDREDFSSTKEGRIHQLGRELEYNMRPTRYLGLFYLASWIQDACLDLRHCPEFVYLPRELVSTGKPILFDNEQNFIDFVKSHKRGRLQSRYAYLMGSTLNGSLEMKVVPRLFTKSGEHRLQITKDTPLPEGIKQYEVFTTPRKEWYRPWVVGRLQKYLISETEIKAKLNQLKQLFDEVPEFTPATFDSVPVDGTELTDELILKFVDAWRSHAPMLARYKEDTWYVKDPVETILDLSHPLRVDMAVTWNGKRKDKIPTDKMLERDREALQLFEWLLGDGESPPPSELLPDDLVVVDTPFVRNGVGDFYIVTADMQLAKHIASTRWRLRVKAITPKRWVESGFSAMGIGVSTAYEGLYVDQGAVDAYVDTLTDEEIDFICDVANAKPLDISDIIPVDARYVRPPREIREAGPLFK